MYVTLFMRSLVLDEDIPEGFDHNGIVKDVIRSDPAYLYLEDLLGQDEWYTTCGVVLQDGRMIIARDHTVLRELENLPQSERMGAIKRTAHRHAMALLSSMPEIGALPEDIPLKDLKRRVRQAIQDGAPTGTVWTIQQLAGILGALEDCLEVFPFSGDVAEFRAWPFVDITEYQSDDADHSVESVFVVEIHQ